MPAASDHKKKYTLFGGYGSDGGVDWAVIAQAVLLERKKRIWRRYQTFIPQAMEDAYTCLDDCTPQRRGYSYLSDRRDAHINHVKVAGLIAVDGPTRERLACDGTLGRGVGGEVEDVVADARVRGDDRVFAGDVEEGEGEDAARHCLEVRGEGAVGVDFPDCEEAVTETMSWVSSGLKII